MKTSQHWRRTRRLTAYLLLAWFAVTFGSIFYARELAALQLFGWPFPFYLAAQGAVLAYLAIVGIYAWRMGRIDREETGAQP
ncbi:MAG TPA: DUF4212 domain-containing protein [Burkholderiaceae bacterium]